jgi:hypothetical protein
MRWFGWGLLLLSGAMFAAEFVIYGYVRPEITPVKWAVPIIAAALIYLSYKREKELYNEHLPH